MANLRTTIRKELNYDRKTISKAILIAVDNNLSQISGFYPLLLFLKSLQLFNTIINVTDQNIARFIVFFFIDNNHFINIFKELYVMFTKI